MTQNQINDILKKHKMWLNGEEGGERANLIGSNLSGSNLSGSDLSNSDLSGSDLSNSDLSNSNLSNSDLSNSDLRGSDLRYSNLIGSNLIGSNLSGSEGLLSTINFMEAHFKRVADGYLVYKTFNGSYPAPDSWRIEKSSVIEEICNYDRCTECASGINVAPLDWVKRQYPNGTIWKCLIRWEWLCGVCVPYMTDGKIRCERLELLEVVE